MHEFTIDVSIFEKKEILDLVLRVELSETAINQNIRGEIDGGAKFALFLPTEISRTAGTR